MDHSSCFGHYGSGDDMPRQWLSAVVTSAILYTGIVIVVLAAGAQITRVVHGKNPVSVKFVETVVKPQPPPVVKAAPVPVPPPKAVRKQNVKPPPKTIVPPKELPTDIPAEAEPGPNQGIAVWEPDASELASGVRNSGGVKSEITEQMKGVVAARPYKSNQPPEYPPTARHTWTTDHVVLKIRITRDGQVDDVKVVAGNEPFVTEAEKAVAHWRYYPARYHGEPIAVYRVIKIAFQIV